MKTSSKKNVQRIVEHLIQWGMKHVVISPGSRNAPFIIAMNQHPDIECVVVPDERCAAFFALGMAQQLKLPVGLVCTSGSAPLNYYPAIAEAYYQRIPLVVITADRPKAWVNQGDGQTIVQENVFQNHINYSTQFEDSIESKEYEWYMHRELSIAFNHALGNSKGPVHINVAFSEPLYGTVEVEKTAERSPIILEAAAAELSSEQVTYLQQQWSKSTKKMILCGQLDPNPALQAALKELARDPSVLILVENTSNLVDFSFVHCIDRTLNAISDEEKADFAPDLLVILGGAVVSKRIKSYLRSFRAAEVWKIGFDFPFMDTYQSLSKSYQVPELNFIRIINRLENASNSNYGSRWKQKDLLVQEKKIAYFETQPEFGDLTVFNQLLDCIPEHSHLHMANSSVVRYCQLFDPVSSITYWCNRGTSGIDGSSSTAVGAAYALPDDWHTLLTGDMSFFYDSNAFWNHLLRPNLRIFLINNGGGGIFKIIPGPDSTAEQADFFVYNNQFSAEHICKTFSLDYFRAESAVEIDEQLERFYTFEEQGRPKLMEIFTNIPKDSHKVKHSNEGLLSDFFDKIKL